MGIGNPGPRCGLPVRDGFKKSPEGGHSLARFTVRNGMRLRRKLLAQAARLAASRRVGSTARRAAGETASGREDRLLPRGRRLIVDSCGWGGRKTGPNRTDRARPGSKHHIATDANGTPIAAILTGANRNDVTQLVPLIEAIVPIGGVRGRPLSRPGRVYADRGYDHDKIDASFMSATSPPASCGAVTRTVAALKSPLGRRTYSCLAASFPPSTYSL